MEGGGGQEEDKQDKCKPHLVEMNLINSMHGPGSLPHRRQNIDRNEQSGISRSVFCLTVTKLKQSSNRSKALPPNTRSR